MQLLLALKSRAGAYDEMLEDFVLECRDGGASARGIAEALGVGASTVQTWTANARRRRDG
jgi:transposase